jgi:hypothetical protein
MFYQRLAWLLMLMSQTIGAVTCPVPPTSIESARAKQLALNKLNQFLQCDPDDPINDQSPCNTFAARGLAAIYSVTDFQTTLGFLSANAIADYVAHHGKWVAFGMVFDENNNLCAQALANSAYPVIAVMQATGHGHIALIIPGEPQQSSTWRLLTANSASFFYEKPATAYVGGPLSKAFDPAHARNAVFYYRNADVPGTQ